MRGTQLKRVERDEREGSLPSCPQHLASPAHRATLKLIGLTFVALAITYAAMFVRTASGPWFDPTITNDDAQQQLYPLHRAVDPELFKDDLITRCMEGYLAPIHYGLSYAITLLTQNPIMTGHWVMFIQFTLGLLFIFGTVRAYAGFYPALFSAVWYLHSRPLWARMVGGLPRGWMAPILLCYLYCISTKRYGAVLGLIAIAGMLNPPAAFLICAAHGLLLGWQCLISSDRTIWLRRGLLFGVVAIVSGASILYVVKRPPEIGQMVTLEQASKMPAFQIRGGRFAFLPFPTPLEQFTGSGSKAFIQNSKFAPEWIKPAFFPILATAVVVFAIVGKRRRMIVVPTPLLLTTIAVVIVYFLARYFAFKLYVPNRYLLVPLNLMWIAIFPIAIWKISGRFESRQPTLGRFAGLACLGGLILAMNGLVVRSAPGFDISTDLRAGFYSWAETATAKDAVFIGHPDSLNGLPLMGKRIVYVNSEVAHPFYVNYYEEMTRRINIALRLSYARSWGAFRRILGSERVDYFVFTARDYEEARLKKSRYVLPFSALVKRLARRHKPEEFLFAQLPRKADPNQFPYVVFASEDSIVVDLKKLRENPLPVGIR